MTEPGSGEPPYAGHWQYQDPYAAPPAAPPSAFPFAPPSPPPFAPVAPMTPFAPVLPMPPMHYDIPAHNGLATAGMVLGIISIPGATLVFLDLAIVLLGLVFGVLGLRRANRMPRQLQVGKEKAIAGIACACIGLVLSVSLTAWIYIDWRLRSS